jgi:transcriptional regulator with XRE-family HTH domain
MAIQFNRIGEILKDRGISQTWLSKKLGISTSTMNQICLNKHQPNVERLFEIAEILSVHPCDLLGDGKEKE